MLTLLALIAYMHFHSDDVESGIGITAKDLSTNASHAAPNFVLNDLSGRPVSLNEFKGKVVLLGFWTTW